MFFLLYSIIWPSLIVWLPLTSRDIVQYVYCNCLLTTIICMVIWNFLMFYQIFLSLQLKRCAVITYKHGIYKLPKELPSNLRLRILGNIRYVSKFQRMIAECPVPPTKMNNLPMLLGNLWKQKLNFFWQCAISYEN